MVDSSLALKDASERLKATDPALSCIVQAPAGSGKTELLTQRYLRLLACVEKPEQILAITFTRKAANEMRNRILKYLKSAHDPRPNDPHQANNWELARTALAANDHHGWRLEQHSSRLKIQTIDSFNASLSRRLPLLSFMGSSMEIAQDAAPLYEAACQRLIRRLAESSEAAAHLDTLLRHLANRTYDLIEMLCDLLMRRDQWLTLVMQHHGDTQALRKSIEQTLQAEVAHRLQELLKALPADMHAELAELAAFGATNLLVSDGSKKDERLLMACCSLIQLPLPDVSSLSAWQGIAQVLLTSKGEFYTAPTKLNGFPADKKQEKMRMTQLLADMNEIQDLNHKFAGLANLSAEITDQQWQVLQALIRLLPELVSMLWVEFSERGQVDYVEVSQRALRALGTEDQPTDLGFVLDEQIQHILIDEFQDTSIAQKNLLERLTADWALGDGRTVFCVGDPMQSIYRFRQAEVGIFLDLQQHGLRNVEIKSLKLQTNFRSTQTIVGWVNELFQKIMPATDDVEMGAVSYTHCAASPQATTAGIVKVHAGISQSAADEASQIATLVSQALSADAQQKIAILVSSRKHADPIAQSLKQAGISFNAVDIEQLQDRPLVRDLMSLTRALVHLADRTAWLSCLRSPWCGLSLTDLYVIAGEDSKQTIHDLASNCLSSGAMPPDGKKGIKVLSHEGFERLQRFMKVMNAALEQRARLSLHDWIERTWLALNAPACLNSSNDLDNAQAYLARLDELEIAGDLEDIAKLEAQLEQLYAQSGAVAGARVEIMTIHKSKGLEFDVVILPSLHRKPAGDPKRLLKWTRIAGLPADGLVMTPPAAKGDEADRIYKWLDQLEKNRATFERQRLLYVATTRSKRELHLFGSVDLNKDGNEIKLPSKDSFLMMLWPACKQDFERALATYQPSETVELDTVQQTLRRLPLGWQPLVSAPDIIGKQINIQIDIEQPEFDWAGETSRHVGTVVHGELERLHGLSLKEIDQWRGAKHSSRIQIRLAELGVPERLQDEACQRVIQAIEAMLSDAKGRWILGLDSPHQEASAELALSGELDGSVINCIIDRTFVDAQGIRWIIDFKTSRHEGGGLEEFLDREVERYRPQLQRYARLMQGWKSESQVKTALYFPLMGAWREVD